MSLANVRLCHCDTVLGGLPACFVGQQLRNIGRRKCWTCGSPQLRNQMQMLDQARENQEGNHEINTSSYCVLASIGVMWSRRGALVNSHAVAYCTNCRRLSCVWQAVQ